MGLGDRLSGAVGGAVLGLPGAVIGGSVGGQAIWDAASGKSNFQAQGYDPNRSNFTDPNAEANKQSLASALAARQAMETPTATAAGIPLEQIQQTAPASINQAEQAQFRGQQQTLAGMMAQRAAGQGASPAEMQMRAAMGDIARQQRSMAAGARGVSPALAQRMAAKNIASAQQGLAAQAGILRANEQIAAQQSLAGMLSGARGQDIGLATNQAQLGMQAGQFNAGQYNQGLFQNAGFQQQANLANQQAALAAQGQRDQMAQFYTGASLGVDAQGFAAQQAYEQLKAQGYNNAQAINAGISQQNAQGQAQLIGGVINGAASAGAALVSDRNLKTDIADGKKDTEGFLEAVRAHRFRYKGDDTEHLGVMAQEIEKAPGGKGMVRETPIGKAIDVPQAVGRLLAASSTLHERIKKLEAKRAAKAVRKGA